MAPPPAAPANPTAGRAVFVVDSLLLASLYRYCTGQGASEVFAYVAGFPISPDRFLLQHVVPVAHAHQSPIGAKADPISTILVHETLDEWGLQLVAHAHSHPGFGPGATHPSGVDRRFVADLAAGSSRPLGLIFSRDGHLRAYGHEGFEFVIEIHGNGVNKVSDHDVEHLYQIDERLVASDLPVAVPHPAG